MRLKEMAELLHTLVEEEREKTGCGITLRFEDSLFGNTGMIFYHNARTWTITLNRLRMTWAGGGGALSKLWSVYSLSYVQAMLSMDRLVMQENARSFLQGMAMLCHIQRRETDNTVSLYPPRTRKNGYRCRGVSWTPEEVYCDLEALQKTAAYVRQQNAENGKQHTAQDIAGSLEKQLEEAVLFSQMPEIRYRKDGFPIRMLPGLIDWDRIFSGQGPGYAYPVLKPAPGQMLSEKAGTEQILEDLFRAGGPFYGSLAARLFAENLLQKGQAADVFSDTSNQEKRKALEAYIDECVTFIKTCAERRITTGILSDNRIAVERTLHGLSRFMRSVYPDSERPMVHSIGYR